MFEFIVTVTVLSVVWMLHDFHAVVEFVLTLGRQEVHASEVYLVL
jgi:hypothetical protein